MHKKGFKNTDLTGGWPKAEGLNVLQLKEKQNLCLDQNKLYSSHLLQKDSIIEDMI